MILSPTLVSKLNHQYSACLKGSRI